MRTLTFFILCGLACIVVAGIVWYVIVREADKQESLSGVGVVYLPDFTYPDATGAPVRLSEINARVRIINFWASWSPYSREELPALVALKREFGDGIAIVGLNRDTNPADGRAFLTSLALGDELTFAYDQADSYFKTIGGYNVPETIFLGEGGEVLAHIHGPLSYSELKAQVQALLK